MADPTWLRDMATTLPEWKHLDHVGSESTETKWSGPPAPPIVGARVFVHMNGFGHSTVVGYYVTHGYLGLIVRPDILPEWFVKNAPDRRVIMVFGNELIGGAR